MAEELYKIKVQQKNKHIETIEREKFKLLAEKDELDCQLQIKNTEYLRLQERNVRLDKNAKILEGKIEKLKKVYESRLAVHKGFVETLVKIADSFKTKFENTLEILERSNENISLLIETDYSDLKSMTLGVINIEKEFHPKYKKYLQPKVISLIQGLGKSFEGVINYHTLDQTQNKLIKELRGKRFLNETETQAIFENLKKSTLQLPPNLNANFTTSTIHEGSMNMSRSGSGIGINMENSMDQTQDSMLLSPKNKTNNKPISSPLIARKDSKTLKSSFKEQLAKQNIEMNDPSTDISSERGMIFQIPANSSFSSMTHPFSSLTETFQRQVEAGTMDINYESLELIFEQVKQIIKCIEQLCSQNRVVEGGSKTVKIIEKVEQIKSSIGLIENQLDHISKMFVEDHVNINEDEMAELVSTFEKLTKESSSMIIFETGGSTVKNLMQKEIKDLTQKMQKQKNLLSNLKRDCSNTNNDLRKMFVDYNRDELELENLKLHNSTSELQISNLKVKFEAKSKMMEDIQLEKAELKVELDVEKERYNQIENRIREISKEVEKDSDVIINLRKKNEEKKLELLNVYKQSLTNKDIILEENETEEVYNNKIKSLQNLGSMNSFR